MTCHTECGKCIYLLGLFCLHHDFFSSLALEEGTVGQKIKICHQTRLWQWAELLVL